jgi:hypothetical protein
VEHVRRSSAKRRPSPGGESVAHASAIAADFRAVNFLLAGITAMDDAAQIRRAVAGADAARERAPPGEDDQRQFLQRLADQHLVETSASRLRRARGCPRPAVR